MEIGAQVTHTDTSRANLAQSSESSTQSSTQAKHNPSNELRPKETLLSQKTSKTLALRQWSSADGRYKTNAVLKRLNGTLVVLEKESGGQSNVDLKKLSQTDNQYVRDVIRESDSRTVVIGQVAAGILKSDDFPFVSLDGQELRVVLDGIILQNPATAEGKELFGRFLDIVDDKQGWLEIIEPASGGKPRGLLFVDGTNINLALIAQGIAWYDEQSALGNQYHNAEFLARTDRLGVWSRGMEKPSWTSQ
jgi:hypothetical protein